MRPHPIILSYVAVCAGALAGAYMLLPTPGATEAVSPRPSQEVVDTASQNPADKLAERKRIEKELASARPPIPMATRPRTTPEMALLPVEQARPTAVAALPAAASAASAADAAAPRPAIAAPAATANASSDFAAKAIQADGYKGVRGLKKGPDGKWWGLALRGNVEIAVTVDDSGNVASQ
jgi:hypothetical protein